MIENLGFIVIGFMIAIVEGVIVAALNNKKRSKSPYQENTVTVPEKAAQGNADHILVTTTPALEGHHIAKYIGIVSAETVVGTGFFTEFAAWVADRFSAESSAIERKFKAARVKKYFRFGEVPKNERSIAFNKMTLNQVDSVSYLLDTGEFEQAYAEVPEDALEPGVSVFDLDGDDSPALNNIRLVRSFCARLGGGKDFLGSVIAPHGAYIVSGDEAARGHDGEPLIRNVRILKKLDTDPELFLAYAVGVMKKNFGRAEQGERLDSSRQLYVFYHDLKVNRITGEKVLRWEASGEEWESAQYTEYVLGEWSFQDPLNDNFIEK